MAIQADYTGIKDYEKVCWVGEGDERRLNAATYTLVVPISLHAGLYEITEKNASEWYMRTKLIEACFGGGLMQGPKGETVGLTMDDILAHVGLKMTGTNYYTRNQFFQHLKKDLAGEAVAHFNRYAKRRAEETERTAPDFNDGTGHDMHRAGELTT